MKYALLETAGPPITLDETKKYLNIIHDHHDDMIQKFIFAALNYCESFTGNSYREQSYRLDASAVEMAVGVVIAKNPVSELKGVQVNIDGELVFLDYKQYVFECSESRSFIVIIDNKVLREAATNFDAVKVFFNVNYSPVPDSIIETMKSLVAFLYENRGDTPSLYKTALPSEILNMLEQDRVLFL